MKSNAKSDKMKLVHLYVPEDLKRDYQAVAADMEIPASTLIRISLRNFVKKYQASNELIGV